MVIAADGGARHCLALGIVPDIVIGDFDSLGEQEIAALDNAETEFIRYPADKDETDLELALDQAVKLGASEITLYGLLGGRWDMIFANMLLLASPSYDGIRVCVVDGNTRAYIIRSGETLELSGQSGDTVSAIPLSEAAHGITYKGLQWPLEDATLAFGSPKGVSNRLANTTAQVSVESGILLVIMTAANKNA